MKNRESLEPERFYIFSKLVEFVIEIKTNPILRYFISFSLERRLI